MLKIKRGVSNLVKIVDFGLATLLAFMKASRSNNGHSNPLHTFDRGTIEYMAPEVDEVVFPNDCTKARYSTKADIYSLGVIFGEILHIDIDG